MEKYMEEALIEAKKANEINEVPVGCVFVYRDKTIAGSCNLVNASKNATQHAELVCIDQVFNYCKTRNLNANEIFKEISVVVTVEPCIMCASALYELNVSQIVYGCPNDRFGGNTVLDVAQLLKSPVRIYEGVRANEAMSLLKNFYKGENPSAPIPKIRKK